MKVVVVGSALMSALMSALVALAWASGAFGLLEPSVPGSGSAASSEASTASKWLGGRAGLAEAQQQIAELEVEIAALQREAEALESDPFAIEQAIREELRFAKAGETVVRLTPSGGPGLSAGLPSGLSNPRIP